ncbi:hypothetical protein [Paenibacillus sp. FSL R10-2734]|uniref:hypothetical protein n=1 Tax=Paenibacillus sp. FSL R10-2734 TaxID=2954691 RepID=UPI0030DBB9BF
MIPSIRLDEVTRYTWLSVNEFGETLEMELKWRIISGINFEESKGAILSLQSHILFSTLPQSHSGP